ncbi:hypothetical protein CPB85DRAFT_914977 [Mucidula mucida]|nr:hypothetical protein CPB85DRAFT_914977 [Mucidula mucida]
MLLICRGSPKSVETPPSKKKNKHGEFLQYHRSRWPDRDVYDRALIHSGSAPCLPHPRLLRVAIAAHTRAPTTSSVAGAQMTARPRTPCTSWTTRSTAMVCDLPLILCAARDVRDALRPPRAREPQSPLIPQQCHLIRRRHCALATTPRFSQVTIHFSWKINK